MGKIIGLDIGTTNIKGELYDIDGKTIDIQSISYDLFSIKNSWVEQNANEWVDIVIKILNNFFVKFKDIKAIGMSTQGGTLVPVDEKFNPLRNAITWMDTRASEQKSNILREISEYDIYKITGWKLLSNLPLLQIAWLKSNEPYIFKSGGNKFMFVNDFIQRKLCDASFMDYSNACMTMLFNILEKKWSDEILNILGISLSRLSTFKGPTEIVGNICNKGLQGNFRKTLLANSAHDQYCVSLASNGTENNRVLLATGTAWVIFTTTNSPFFNKSYFSPGVHVLPGKYGLISVLPAGGNVLNWFLNTFLESEREKEIFLKEADDNAAEILNIEDDCIFLPLFNGIFGPIWNDMMRGSFINLGFDLNIRNLYKSILEGVGFQIKWLIEAFKELGIKIDEIKMIGGAAKSKIQTQLISDITGLKIYLPSDLKTNYACRGAAMIAGVSSGIYKDFYKAKQVFKEKEYIIYPRSDKKGYFEKKYERYRKAVIKGMEINE